MLIWAIVATALFFGAAFVIFNLLRKYEKLEDELDELHRNTESNYAEISELVTFIDKEIRAIDKRGSFEADDEVGFFFKKVKELGNLLNEYI